MTTTLRQHVDSGRPLDRADIDAIALAVVDNRRHLPGDPEYHITLILDAALAAQHADTGLIDEDMAAWSAWAVELFDDPQLRGWAETALAEAIAERQLEADLGLI